MLYSMTGYGRVERQISKIKFVFELKSLNGKQFDLRLQVPPILKPFEFNIRNLLSEKLQRGSFECSITYGNSEANTPAVFDLSLLKSYYLSIKQLCLETGEPSHQIIPSLLTHPDLMNLSAGVLDESFTTEVEALAADTAEVLDNHRKQEGIFLEAELMKNIEKIETLAIGLEEQLPLRKEKIRENIVKLLEEKVGQANIDSNRFEQEIIYYLERIDINEEQSRLKNHLNYFKEIISEPEKSKGKKLSFLLQEIGREINTTGAKAYHAEIQKIVVLMKDELEKAKEQTMNVL